VVIVAVLVSLAGATGAARADDAGLVGTVGTNDSFQLGLVDASGAAVSHLAAGTYTLVVHDKSTFHNFHLFGPGVNRKTGVAFTGSRSWKVTLSAGTYRFRCDVHPTTMHGSFSVS